MLKLGTQNIAALCLGGQSIKKAYLGQELVFGSGPAPIATYTITASIDPAGSGTVTGAGKYQAGDTVTLVATVADGYAFTGWQENGQTVSTGETYTFTAAGDRTLVAVFEEAKASRLPEGYTEVEYVQFSASSYVSTSIKPSTSFTTTIDFEPISTSGTKYIIHSVNTTSGSPAYTYVYSAAWTTAGVKAYMGRWATATLKTVDSNTALRRMILKLVGADGTVSIDGGAPVSVVGTQSYSSSGYIYLGYANGVALPMKLYSCQMEKSGELVRDFVPCTNSSGTAGLYDLVNSKFYRSANAAFIAGPAV